jgi:DNA (cytosine-5)-methyltransferase 1
VILYTDIDESCVSWLAHLVQAGHLPKGECRLADIRSMDADELRSFAQVHLFCGIGGWPYALKLAGWPTDRPVWTGSCPCQPFSRIGKKRGEKDERHLWPNFRSLIGAGKPPVVLGEQVADQHGRHWLSGVRADLEALGYEVGAADLCAAGVGAPHIRQRLYWVGDAQRSGLERHAGYGAKQWNQEETRSDSAPSRRRDQSSGVDAMPVLRGLPLHNSRDTRCGLRLSPDRRVGCRPVWERFDALPCSDGWRRVRPGTFPVAHGIPARVVRLRGYGNAIVPELGAKFVRAFLVTESTP